MIGFVQLEDAQRDQPAAVAVLVDALRLSGIVEGGAAAAEVGAGTIAAAGARHDDRAHCVIGVGAIEGVDQLAAHLLGEGVEAVGPIQRDRQNAFADLVADLSVLHRAPLLAAVAVTVGARHAVPLRYVVPIISSQKHQTAAVQLSADFNFYSW